MMKMILKTIYGVFIAVGFVLVLGAAGSDCDGKCMENAMPLDQLMIFSFGGLFMIGLGALGLIRINQ
jgi:hypothetical protein